MYRVYGRKTSSNVQALLWCLEELALPYTRLDYGETFGGLDTPDFRALNPHGKIPVLEFGDTALFETPAILRYLAEAHGGAAFWPRDPVARAQVDMWATWAKIEVAIGFTGPIFWEAVRTPRDLQNPAVIRENVQRFEHELAIAEARLTQTRFLCSHDLTLADIQFGHVLFRYYDIEIQRRDLPAVRAYYERLAQRPAYQKAVMVPYDALRGAV